MPSITLSEAIAALKEAKQDPATISRELAILEGEIERLQSQVKSKRELIRTLRKLAGGPKAISRAKTAKAGLGDVLPEGPTENQQRLIGYLKKHGPQVASEIAKDLGMQIGPLVSTLTRSASYFVKQPNACWALTAEASA